MGKSKGSKFQCYPSVDRISQLPDSIIDNILIRLSIADAARTAILSRKWKHAWISISKLKFDHSFASKLKKVGHPNSIKTIYGILMLHSGPIVGFKLSITSPKKISEIDRIFHFLSRNSVQELDVCILQRGKGYREILAGYILPSHFYSCLQLWCLKIANCTINPPCNFGGFRNLNSLELQYLELTNSVFENFIFKCPLLEELIIEYCNFVEPSVIKINASNLKSFYFNGIGSCFRFISAPLLNSLKYIDSRAYEGDGRNYNYEGEEKSSLEEFCNALPALESLKVDYYFLQTLDVCNFSSKYGRRPKWLHQLKSLQAYYVGIWNMDEVTSLLGLIGSSPNLTKLDIEMDLPDHAAGRDNPFISLEPNDLDFSCKRLQVVSLSNFAGHDSGMDFAKLLLLKSYRLTTMYISNFSFLETMEILEKVNGFRRASAAAEVKFF